jgi:hypothetical protein
MISLFLSNPGRTSLIISSNKDILIIIRISLLEQAFSLGGCWHGRISRLYATSKYNVEIKFSDGVFPAMLTMENYANNYISRVHSHVTDIRKEEVQAATFMECPGVWGLVV